MIVVKPIMTIMSMIAQQKIGLNIFPVKEIIKQFTISLTHM